MATTVQRRLLQLPSHAAAKPSSRTKSFFCAQAAAARERLLSDGGDLTEGERRRIQELLEQLGGASDSGALDAWHVGWGGAGNGASA